MAHAEIIDGDADAGPPQALQDLEREIEILHRHALGDLQLEGARIQPRLFDRRLDAVDQRQLAELSRGEIDGNAEIVKSHVAKRTRLIEGGPQHPIAYQ